MLTIVTSPDGQSVTLEDTPSADDNKGLAVRELSQTDRTIIRCGEAGVAVPDDWRAYRVALRTIAGSGTVPDAGWPTRPDYPANT